MSPSEESTQINCRIIGLTQDITPSSVIPIKSFSTRSDKMDGIIVIRFSHLWHRIRWCKNKMVQKLQTSTHGPLFAYDWCTMLSHDRIWHHYDCTVSSYLDHIHHDDVNLMGCLHHFCYSLSFPEVLARDRRLDCWLGPISFVPWFGILHQNFTR